MSGAGRITLGTRAPVGECLRARGRTVPFDSNQNRELSSVAKVIALLFCLFLCPRLNAQVTVGTLAGRIASSAGAPIANALLTVKNTAKGGTKTINAKVDGSFSLRNLAPGVFEVTVTAKGFVAVRTTVTVIAGTDSRADIVMQAESSTSAGTGRGNRSHSVFRPGTEGFRNANDDLGRATPAE